MSGAECLNVAFEQITISNDEANSMNISSASKSYWVRTIASIFPLLKSGNWLTASTRREGISVREHSSLASEARRDDRDTFEAH